MRRDIDVTDTAFPYLSPTTAYILVRDDGGVSQVLPGTEIVCEVRDGKARLFAVWPGQWRSDVFTIDPDALLAELKANAEWQETRRQERMAENARMAEERRSRPKERCPRCRKDGLRVRDDGSLYIHRNTRGAECGGGSAYEMAEIRRRREAAERQRIEREQRERDAAESRARHEAEYERLDEEFRAGRLDGHAKRDGSLCRGSLTAFGASLCTATGHGVSTGELAQWEAKLAAWRDESEQRPAAG